MEDLYGRQEKIAAGCGFSIYADARSFADALLLPFDVSRLFLRKGKGLHYNVLLPLPSGRSPLYLTAAHSFKSNK